jgi:ATP-dependent DNA ligase
MGNGYQKEHKRDKGNAMQKVAIKSIKKLDESYDKYDISVRDNANFFANGILVHNCRCLGRMYNGKPSLKSRKNKEFPHLNHIREDIKTINLDEKYILDGELYSDEITFQEIVGIIRKEKVNDEDLKKMELIKYRVYDMINLDNLEQGFTDRINNVFVKIGMLSKPLEHIIMVESSLAENIDDIYKFHSKFVEEGYEGAMIRDMKAPYAINKRSDGLLKYKHFQDDEFKIVGFHEGIGDWSKCVIWECENSNGQMFSVKPKLSIEESKKMFKDASKYIGKMLTVRYFELTNDGIPRFPVGIEFRDYEG